MQSTYTNPVYEYQKHPDQNSQQPVHHPVIILGAGPCGLAAALDLASHGIASVVLDDNNTVSVGSRAICFAKRTLEIFDRYGVASRMVDKGVTWKKGKVFFKKDLVYEFDLQPEDHHKMPAFINLQQYYVEQYMVEEAQRNALIDLRWLNRVEEVNNSPSGVSISVVTPDGEYHLHTDYLLVADGAGSPTRKKLGLESKGQVFQDRFLIADVLMESDFPTERWFWFDPEFHPNQSALLHREADNVWRIDLQLGWDADPDVETQEEVIRPRLEAMLGKDTKFSLEWASVYTFQCRKLDNFIHDRVIFMGDAAHQVSPFGARGANGGVQSVENLAWKIAYVLKGKAGITLIDSYNTERQHGASENIRHSTQATDFITPKNTVSRLFRDETLRLAKRYPFARPLINSGRLSHPCSYETSPLVTQDSDEFDARVWPGSVAIDAPVACQGEPCWLLNYLGLHFALIIDVTTQAAADDAANLLNHIQPIPELTLLFITKDGQSIEGIHPAWANRCLALNDTQGLVKQRYDLSPGTAYLVRPDQVIAARWRILAGQSLRHAYFKALAQPEVA